MTPKEKAKELVDKMDMVVGGGNYDAKEYSLIAVDYIITSNPHSNPFNTDVHSTMAYWMNVKKEIQKL